MLNLDLIFSGEGVEFRGGAGDEDGAVARAGEVEGEFAANTVGGAGDEGPGSGGGAECAKLGGTACQWITWRLGGWVGVQSVCRDGGRTGVPGRTKRLRMRRTKSKRRGTEEDGTGYG